MAYCAQLQHKTKYIQFCLDNGGCIHYSISEDKQQTPTQNDVMAMPELPFPTEVVSSGECGGSERVGIPSAPRQGHNREGTTWRLGANAHFQVLSDGEVIYLFRNTHSDEAMIPRWENDPFEQGLEHPPMVSSCSLLVDRFELEDPKGQDGNQPVPILKLKEHRRTNGEGSVHHPEPTGALNFITDVANGDFEVFWDEDPAGKGWKTWKVTATRVTSALLVHYCVQRRPAGIYLQSGVSLVDPVPDALADENSRKILAARTPGTVADLVWSCWVLGASPTEMGLVAGLNLTKLKDSEEKIYKSLLGVLGCDNVNNVGKKHRRAAADTLTWFVVNSALATKDLKVVMRQLSELSKSKRKEIEVNSLRAIKNLCEHHEDCKQIYKAGSSYPSIFPLSTDGVKNVYLNEIYNNLSELKNEALSKHLIDAVMKGKKYTSSNYVSAFLVLSPWVRLLIALLMMIVLSNMLAVLESLANHLTSMKAEKKKEPGHVDAAMEAIAIAGGVLTFALRLFGGGK